MQTVTKDVRRAARRCGGLPRRMAYCKLMTHRRHRREVRHKFHQAADLDDVDLRPAKPLTGWDID